jgi:hypothetical protein
LKVILGLVWRLILTFQVDQGDDDENKDMSAAQSMDTFSLRTVIYLMLLKETRLPNSSCSNGAKRPLLVTSM